MMLRYLRRKQTTIHFVWRNLTVKRPVIYYIFFPNYNYVYLFHVMFNLYNNVFINNATDVTIQFLIYLN